ncbi:hypothetical protein NQ314_008827 [Rhamnusium bicolor]|uniref:PiggyBac transposable element-derived protein domain-containing protein n=1 Tax=Rhamnusium bicolor TaxID=1586634 RepID=A0AAV8Y6L7_9CUCU|nr:hypothetical protein NQ314_008827 [Rhamnusium bicolor]
MFLDDGIINLLAEESNKYAGFINCPPPNITKEEIRCFVAILYLTEYVVLPGKIFYWDSGADIHNKLVSDAMRRDRFIQCRLDALETLVRATQSRDSAELASSHTPTRSRSSYESERNNKQRIAIGDEHDAWEAKITEAQHSINGTINTTTGCVPAELLYGFRPRQKFYVRIDDNEQVDREVNLKLKRKKAAEKITKNARAMKTL